MPRSGTKLIRAILNNHSCIAVSDIETEFLPFWIKHWGKYGDLSQRNAFGPFYREALKLPYFICRRDQGRVIPADVWFSECRSFTPAGVFEALIRHDVGVNKERGKLWGDKSPTYLKHMPLLKSIYPDARFIHIVRDVRDYCLSINKAWGKHLLRAAQRWADWVVIAKKDALKLGSDYAEVKYEELLDSPAATVQKICFFLDLPYEPKMIAIHTDVENLGDAKGAIGILCSNKEKYLAKMTPTIRARIEKIAGPSLRLCGYPITDIVNNYRLGAVEMLLYQIQDGYSLVRSEMKVRSLNEAVRFHLAHFLSSEK